jgi:hypothetical protein
VSLTLPLLPASLAAAVGGFRSGPFADAHAAAVDALRPSRCEARPIRSTPR